MSQHHPGNGRFLKARPDGRASLAEVLARLANEAHDLDFQYRWIASSADLAGSPEAMELDRIVRTSAARLAEALLNIAVDVKLGPIGLRLPPGAGDDSPEDRPILAAIEARREDSGERSRDSRADGGDRASPVAAMVLDPQSSGLKTFEVLDRGPKEPGHVQFQARDLASAEAHSALTFNGLPVREVTDPALMVANQKGSLGQPKGRGAASSKRVDTLATPDPVVGRDPVELLPSAIAGTNSERIAGPLSDDHKIIYQPIVYDVFLDWFGRIGNAPWVGRIEVYHARDIDRVADEVFGELPGGKTLSFYPAKKTHDAKVKDAGGMEILEVDGVKIGGCNGMRTWEEVAVNPDGSLLDPSAPSKPKPKHVPGVPWRERTPKTFLSADLAVICRAGGLETLGDAWDSLESGSLVSDLGWSPLEAADLHAGLVAIRYQAGDPAPCTEPLPRTEDDDDDDQAEPGMTMFDVLAVNLGPKREGKLWLARIEAPGFDEVEVYAEGLIGIPSPPIEYVIRPEDDEFDVSVERSGGFRSVHTFDSTDRPIEVRASIAQDARDVIIPRHPAPPEEPTEPVAKLDTDDLLHVACNRWESMTARWEAMRRDGATDLEIRAGLARAFDEGTRETNSGRSLRGGSFASSGGTCSYEAGDFPKFWGSNATWDGRPTLEGPKLVQRARAVLAIPTEPGGTPPARKGTKAKKGGGA